MFKGEVSEVKDTRSRRWKEPSWLRPHSVSRCHEWWRSVWRELESSSLLSAHSQHSWGRVGGHSQSAMLPRAYTPSHTHYPLTLMSGQTQNKAGMELSSKGAVSSGKPYSMLLHLIPHSSLSLQSLAGVLFNEEVATGIRLRTEPKPSPANSPMAFAFISQTWGRDCDNCGERDTVRRNFLCTNQAPILSLPQSTLHITFPFC